MPPQKKESLLITRQAIHFLIVFKNIPFKHFMNIRDFQNGNLNLVPGKFYLLFWTSILKGDCT